MKIVIKCLDGNVQIMTLIQGSVEEALKKWADVHPGKYLSHREMSDESIPIDREFREAWADITPEPIIDIDMVKARTIHLDRIRDKRDAKLAELDVEGIKAQDTGDITELEKIRQKKQELRDIPQTLQSQIEAAQNVEELKAIQPMEIMSC